MKSDNFEGSAPALPIAGIEALARLWAGQGGFLDWLAPEDWDLDLAWSGAQVRARVADLILTRFAKSYLRYLPRHAGEWMDLISQQLQRQLTRTDLPTAHTDWAATLSEYGRYPSEIYIERRPVATFDTPHTRVLKWTAAAVRRAEALVQGQFGRAAIRPDERSILTCPLELAEVAGAADEIRPTELDLEICKSTGGAWLLMGRLAEELAALWFGSAIKQFHSLAPALPELGHQLFEIGTLGALLNELRKQFGSEGWATANPLAAAKSNQPSIIWSGGHTSCRAFFQTPPLAAVYGSAPYLSLARKIGGSALRPDIWLELSGSTQLDIIVECKYSFDTGYIASAITQLIGYDAEYPSTGRSRLLIAVGPEEVITRPWSCKGAIAICSPADAGCLVAAAVAGSVEELMAEWCVN